MGGMGGELKKKVLLERKLVVKKCFSRGVSSML